MADSQPSTATSVAARRGSDFAALARVINDAGLLRRRRASYFLRAVLTLGFAALTCVVVVAVGDSWLQLINAAALAFAFGQIAFLGHDAGHQAIFASRRNNDAAGRLLGNIMIGLSFGWWVDTHNRHHANPNHEEHDPDIGDGVLAFTTAQAAKRGGPVSRFIARRQAWLFFPLLTLEGISLHVDSVVAVVTDRFRSTRGGSRRFEALALVLHLALYATLLLLVMSPVKAIAFAGVHQAAWGFYMGCTFAPSHKGMAIIRPGQKLDFLRRQVLTSRNVSGGRLIAFMLGGLNFQIEHHLFPNMPRSALRRAQPLVRAHCHNLGLAYSEASLLGCYRAALTHLNEIGAPLRKATQRRTQPALS